MESITRYLLSAFFIFNRSHTYFAFRINIKKGFAKGIIAFKKISCTAWKSVWRTISNIQCTQSITFVFCIKNLGSLWSFSCFSYEDYNGDLQNLFHGTQHIALQVITAVCFQQKITEIIPILPYKSKESLLFEKLYFKSHHKIQTHLIEEINGTTSALGLLKIFKAVGWERSVIEQYIGRI